MAAIGTLKPPQSSAAGTCTSPVRDFRRTTSLRKLSFSSQVSGAKISHSVQRRRSRGAAVVVSPKAVSDSQNSQTCLDPDASRV